MPREGRDNQHLANITRPDHEKQRVFLDKVLRGRVERRQAEAGEEKTGSARQASESCSARATR